MTACAAAYWATCDCISNSETVKKIFTHLLLTVLKIHKDVRSFTVGPLHNVEQNFL